MEAIRQDDCIFCKIVRCEIPSAIVYSDDDVIAFRDISPQAPVHVLVIPREHYTNLSAGIPAKLLGSLFSAVPTVAEQIGVNETGYRVIVNNGADANQTVGHLHVHILGGRSMSHGMVKFSRGDAG